MHLVTNNSPLVALNKTQKSKLENDYKLESYNNLRKSEEIKGKINDFNFFTNSLSNPEIENKHHFSSFILRTKELKLQNNIYTETCNALTKKIGNGKEIIEQNFLSLLSLRDKEYKNPFDKILSLLTKEVQTREAISQITQLAASLYSQPYATSTENLFKQLSPLVKGMLCKKIWELDNQPWGNPNYGYETAIKDLQKLLNHKNCNIIEDTLDQLRNHPDLSPSFIYEIQSIFPEQIAAKDSLALFCNTKKIHQLRDLHYFVNDEKSSNEFLVSKYENLDPELKKILTSLISSACYQTVETGFAQKFITEDPRRLLNFQSDEKKDILTQLIEHYSGIIASERKITDLQNMTKKCAEFHSKINNNNKDNIRKIYTTLDESLQDKLQYEVWYLKGGKENPKFVEDYYYGKNEIEKNACVLNDFPTVQTAKKCSIAYSCWERLQEEEKALKKQISEVNEKLVNDFRITKTLPEQPIDVSYKNLEKEEGLVNSVINNGRKTFVSFELGGVAATGGLAGAVRGLVEATGVNKSRVILPLYRGGPIKTGILDSMKQTKHKIYPEFVGKTAPIYKTKIDGIRCYFVDIPDLFTYKPSEDIYAGAHDLNQKRAIYFQAAAARLAYEFSKKDEPSNIVHLSDAQTGLVSTCLASFYPKEWKEGKTPATIFTFHNNLVPMELKDQNALYNLGLVRLPREEINSFAKATLDSDVVTTVSERFGKEAQDPHFGNGVDSYVKKAAFEGKLVGIPNGNNISEWNPATDKKLENWKSVLQGSQNGHLVDLRYNPNMSNEELASITIRNQKELCEYLKQQPYGSEAYADLDPTKPIWMYLGRYDSSQKGIDKLPLIMEEILKNGGQFISVGTVPDDKANEFLDQMQKRAKELNYKGVLILRDRKEAGIYKFQGTFGSQLRASARGIFPSSFEPFGLITGEFNAFGQKVIATKTGGFADTINESNGYLFDRDSNWYSWQQADSIRNTVAIGVKDSIQEQNALYSGDKERYNSYMDNKRSIMQNALNSSWTTRPDNSLSPIDRYKLVDAKALQRRQNRGNVLTNLNVFKG